MECISRGEERGGRARQSPGGSLRAQRPCVSVGGRGGAAWPLCPGARGHSAPTQGGAWNQQTPLQGHAQAPPVFVKKVLEPPYSPTWNFAARPPPGREGTVTDPVTPEPEASPAALHRKHCDPWAHGSLGVGFGGRVADSSTDLVSLGGMSRHLLKRVMLVCSLCGRQWEGQGHGHRCGSRVHSSMRSPLPTPLGPPDQHGRPSLSEGAWPCAQP